MPARFFSLFTGILACLSSSSPAFAFETVKFSSVQQCGPFKISLSGGKPPVALPLTLTVLPFQSSPIYITIPNSSWSNPTSTGDAVAYLPFATGTEFIASLADAQGQGVGLVSDIIKILPSANNTCVAATLISRKYIIKSTLIQCQPFDVVYNATARAPPSSVHAFRPLGPSYFLNQTQSDGAPMLPPFQIASYQAAVPQGTQIIMLFSDNSGYHESSDLISVLGNTTSSPSCLSSVTGYDAGGISQHGSPSSHLSGKAVVAAAATIIVVLVIVAVLIGVYVYRYHWQSRGLKMGGIEGGPGFDYPKGLDPDPPSPPTKMATTYSIDILYPMKLSYSVDKSPTSPNFVQPTPIVLSPQQFKSYQFTSTLQLTAPCQRSVRRTEGSSESGSLTELDDISLRNRESVTMSDIEQLLNPSPRYSLGDDAMDSKLEPPEPPHALHSPHPFSIAFNTAMSGLEGKEGPAAFPVSPMPSVLNFGNSSVMQESSSRIESTELGEIIFQRAWDEVDPAQSMESDGTHAVNTPSQILQPPERAVTRHTTSHRMRELGSRNR